METNYYIEYDNNPNIMKEKFTTHIQEHLGKGLMVHAHIHECIEILYTLNGSFKIILNGLDYKFKKGDMVLITSNAIHNVFACDDNLNSYICIKFDPSLLYTSQFFLKSKYLMPFILHSSTHQKIFKKEILENTKVPTLIKDIHNEYTNTQYGYELAARSDILSLFTYILRYWYSQNTSINIDYNFSNETEYQLYKVFDYIETNYYKNMTAKEMSNYCNMSYSYFSRVFNHVTKKNFNGYLNYIRISKAENKLINTDLSITEIALDCGFSTSSYFISQFKKQKGITPKVYRTCYSK